MRAMTLSLPGTCTGASWSPVRSYAESRELSSGHGVFPLRMALGVATAVTKLVVRVADPRYRNTQRIPH